MSSENQDEISSDDLGETVASETFVLTGTFPVFKRDQAQTLIRTMNDEVSGSVSRKTDCVVAGEAVGNKLRKINTLGMAVLSEGKLLELLGKDTKEAV